MGVVRWVGVSFTIENIKNGCACWNEVEVHQTMGFTFKLVKSNENQRKIPKFSTSL